MEFSEDYILKLSEKTGASVEFIRTIQGELLQNVKDLLDAVTQSNPTGKITKKSISAVKKEKAFYFI